MDKNSHRRNSEKIKVIKYILAPMDMAFGNGKLLYPVCN